MNYYLTAAGLRILSAHSALRNAYRWVGNRCISKSVYIPKTRWIWEEVVKEGVDSEGHALLELGTGWVHAGSLYSALLIDAAITAFDVWDNRTLDGTKNEISRVEDAIQMAEDHSLSDKTRARERSAIALQAKTFDDLYKALNITYVVDNEGIPPLPEASMDMIYSQDVLEHVERGSFDSSILAWRRGLRRDQFGDAYQIVGDQVEQEIGSNGGDAAALGLAHCTVLLAPADRSRRKTFTRSLL